MTRTLLKYQPDYAVPPGATLQEVLDEAGMTQAELAERTGLSAKHINQVIKGHASLTPQTAFRLEPVVGVPAKMWNSLEANYRDSLLRIQETEPSAEAIEWLERLPVAELKKRGHLPRTRDVMELAISAKRFFGVASPSAWENLWASPAASFRLSTSLEVNTGALASWVRITEMEAQRIECSRYDETAFRSGLDEIRSGTSHPPPRFGDWLQGVCSDAGVALVFIPEVKGARVSGAAYWLSPSKPVLALSLRYHSDDHFWFSLFHEAGHILLHPNHLRFIDDGSVVESQFEGEANRFAATLLVPEECEERLMALRTLEEIRAFASEIGIAPGIVVGRLQFEKKIPFRVGNGLKRRLEFTEG